MKIKYNPTELLESINILMREQERSNYPFTSITEAFKNVVNTKQKDNTNLLEYSKFMKQAKVILEAHVGKDILGNYVENLEYFKNATEAEDKEKIKSEEFNKWMAYLLIANLDQSKYSSLANGLASQYFMKNYQHPKELISAADIVKNNQHNDSGTIKT